MSIGRRASTALQSKNDPLRGAVLCMLEAQSPDGAIPWFIEGPWDPWNHGECVMALGVAGELEAMEAGLACLLARQGADGAWLGEYGNVLPMADHTHLARAAAPAFRDTNFAAYCAVVLWHAFNLTQDEVLVRRYWPMVRAALDFVVSLQHEPGDISWSKEAHRTQADDAVRAGCASIHKSLECGLRLAELLGEERPGWKAAQLRLRYALQAKPARFDRTCDRSAFAMDWYYPVLAGAVQGAEAEAALDRRWAAFVEPGLGCRCVRDQPWVTVAESCELVMALVSVGRRGQAADLLSWQSAHCDLSGAYWMGWQFEEEIVWPEERPTWTQAAAILAHDALFVWSSAATALVAS